MRKEYQLHNLTDYSTRWKITFYGIELHSWLRMFLIWGLWRHGMWSLSWELEAFADVLMIFADVKCGQVICLSCTWDFNYSSYNWISSYLAWFVCSVLKWQTWGSMQFRNQSCNILFRSAHVKCWPHSS